MKFQRASYLIYKSGLMRLTYEEAGSRVPYTFRKKLDVFMMSCSIYRSRSRPSPANDIYLSVDFCQQQWKKYDKHGARQEANFHGNLAERVNWLIPRDDL